MAKLEFELTWLEEPIYPLTIILALRWSAVRNKEISTT
jgi:hypothetical protein